MKFRIWDSRNAGYVKSPQIIPADASNVYIVGGGVELFTGYTDRFGAEIFENDMVQDIITKNVTPIYFHDGSFYLDMDDTLLSDCALMSSGRLMDIAVVGNVHTYVDEKNGMDAEAAYFTYHGVSYPIEYDGNGTTVVTVNGIPVDISDCSCNEDILDEITLTLAEAEE